MYTITTVKQILDRKGYDVWSILADATVFDTLEMMAEKKSGKKSDRWRDGPFRPQLVQPGWGRTCDEFLYL